MHIKTKWHKSENKTLEDTASALALNLWKIAVHTVDHIGDENFEFATTPDRFAVLEEILIFLIQIIDRLSYTRHQDNEREILITAIIKSLATNLDDNQNEWLGPGNYREHFLTRFNERAREYSHFAFTGEEPGYQFRRYLGERIVTIMGEKNHNRWIMDQIMEIEIPDALKTLRRTWHGFFGAVL